MARPATRTTSTPQERAFLQHRVGLFGLVSGACYLFFLGFRVVSSDSLDELVDGSFWYHLASSAAFSSIWLICRLGAHSPAVLRWIEGIGLLVGTGAFALMSGYMEPYARPDLVLLLGLSSALTARALYVPSSARRTFALSVAAGAQLVIAVYVAFLDMVPARWASVSADIAALSPEQIARTLAIATAAWWAITVAITTAASHVIYGLRREIRDARQLGQYRLEHKIGEGGMGAVYRASHALLRRPTAIKLLRPDREGDGNQQRFEAEVQHTARLSHPNIITIFDYGHTADGVFYYAMELLEGATLGRIVDVDGPLPVGRVLSILRQIGVALVCAHGEGLIHRDIKPANIVLFLPHRHGGQREQLKLLDFGLVKELKGGGGIDVTRADTVTGTPQYMCPEAVKDPESMDGRSDLYAVGAVAFYLLTGRDLFEGGSVLEVLGHHLNTEPPRASAHAPGPIPAALDDLIVRCVAKAPGDRPDDSLAFLDELARIPDDRPFTADDALQWWRRMEARVAPTPARGRADPGGTRTLDVRRAALAMGPTHRATDA